MPDVDPSSSSKAVFLSYSSDDTAVALAVCEALREAGIEVWMDRSELQGGDAWDANIQRQIRECALIIPIISKRTQARREGYFRLEWRLADERMRLVADGTPLILPVAADETREQEALVPKSFLTVQWSRLPHGHVPPAFVARVRKLLGQESPIVSNSVPAVGTPPIPTGDSFAPLDATGAAQPMRAANDGGTASRRSLWPIAAAAGLALLFGVVGTWFLKSAPKIEPQSAAKPVVRFAHTIPASVTFRNVGRPVAALSPDGRSFVYNTTDGLFLRKLDELEARIIPGTEAILMTNPVFSPDGQSLVFFSGSELRKIAVSGGASVPLASIKESFGISWGRDGSIVFGLQDGIWRLAATGGAPVRIIPAAEGESLSQPQILPDGKSVLFTCRHASGASQVEVASLEGGERKVVVPAGGSGRYLPSTGHLLYLVDRDLFGIAFDAQHSVTRGVAVPLIQGVRVSVLNMAHLAVSDDGTLLYLMGEETLTIPVWVDRQGREEPLKIGPDNYVSFMLSPDASKVVMGFSGRSAASGLLVWDFAGETRTPLTLGAKGGRLPLWSQDGSRIIYDSMDGRISAKPANNTRAPEVILDGMERQTARVSPASLTPDGRTLVFQTTPPNGDIGMMALEDKGPVTWLLNSPKFSETGATLSPDGKWIAYSTNESGRVEVYVSPFPKVDEDRVQISNAGGARPFWSHDGKELFYLGGLTVPTQRLMSATFSADGGKLKVLSRSPVWNATLQSLRFRADPNTARPIGIGRDNQRFLVLKEVMTEGAEPEAERIILVQNWTEELKRLVPIPKN